MNKLKWTTYTLLLLTTLSNNCQTALAAENKDGAGTDNSSEQKIPDYIMDTSQIGEPDNGVIRSDAAMELGSLTPGALAMEGEQSLKRGSIDRALTVLQRAVEMAPMDMDSRILYAQTLQKKLMMQGNKKDPALYNFIVKQWYYVFKKAEYLDEQMQGYSHLIQLTGVKPQMHFEKPQKYFSKVILPEDGSVKVVIGGASPTKQKIAQRNDLDPNTGLKRDF